MKDFKDKIENEQDALDQYSALTHIVWDLCEAKKKESKLFLIALLVSIFINVVIVGMFIWYELQWEYQETVTTVTEQEVSGTGSEINNVDGNQYKDNSTHNEGGGN